MAKSPLNAADAPSILRDHAAEVGWTLCIGAGTSFPMFPTWRGLVRKLLAMDLPMGDVDAAMNELTSTFNLDALIRAAQERLDQDDGAFTQTLRDALYEDLKHRLGSSKWTLVARALAAHHPGATSHKSWAALLDCMAQEFPEVSARGLADVLARTVDTAHGPTAILSFNAEPLLFALVNAQIAVDWHSQYGGDSTPEKPLDRVVGMTSFRRSGRPSYCHCHGLLPVPPSRPGPSVTAGTQAIGTARLVFSESQYLRLATTSFSWQSSVFLQAAMLRPIVFVGVSLSDPNMRRWLSWLHDARREEISILTGKAAVSTTHFWLNKRPSCEHVAKWTEAAVAHLGVRVIWLDEWKSAGRALARLLGTSAPPV